MKQNKITGRIIKGIGGFYYIRPINSLSLIEAKPRGKFRHQKTTPTVGDFVELTVNENEAVIEKIFPRKNAFVRPPVANVDHAVVVFSVVSPKPDFYLIDKLLILAEYHHTAPCIVMTKCDLISNEEKAAIKSIYAAANYPIFCIDNTEKDDLNQLRQLLDHPDQTAFLAGQSGVGKSTLANRICVKGQMATGDLSEKLNRGKHTTRHVELLSLSDGGYLLDTPGFSSLSLLWDDALKADDLCLYFPEFDLEHCKFNTCSHRSEPGCGVKAQLADGQIHPQRYAHYIKMHEDLKNKTTW